MGDDKDWTPATIHDVKGLEETKGGALRCSVVISERGKTRTVEFFIPVKLIDDDSEVFGANTDGKLVIPQWLAEEKEIV